MSTIAYRPGEIAGDTLVTSDGYRIGTARKIGCAGKLLFGAVGNLSYVQEFLKWVQAGMKEDDAPVSDCDENVGVVCEDRFVTTFDHSGLCDRVEVDFYAIGSGAQYAMGAMARGAGPTEAVILAAAFDTRTGGDVDVSRPVDNS